MKLALFLGLLLMVGMVNAASVNVPLGNPGVLPDAPAWGLDKLWDRIMESFQGSDRAQANLIERVEELKALGDGQMSGNKVRVNFDADLADDMTDSASAINASLERNPDFPQPLKVYANKTLNFGRIISSIATNSSLTPQEKTTLLHAAQAQHSIDINATKTLIEAEIELPQDQRNTSIVLKKRS